MEAEKYIKEEDTSLDEIKSNPHSYICDVYEKLYPHMGGRVMSVLSLVPCSLVLPKFVDSNGKENIARLSYLLLAYPGTAKTALSEQFSKFTLNPFPFEYITDSKLDSTVAGKEKVTVIVSDIARIFRDAVLSKQIENIIGDEGKLSRFTQKSNNVEEQKIDAVGYFSGTPMNINKTIAEGNLFRVYPDIIFHTPKQHEEILKKVNRSLGNANGNFEDKTKQIIDYYKKIYAIQEGKGEIEEVKGYIIPESFRDKIDEDLIPNFRKPFEQTNFEFIRELNQCYKIMGSHALLNIFNRDIEKGKIVLEKEDLRVAIELTTRELKTKEAVLKSMHLMSENKIKTITSLNYFINKKLEKEPKSITKLEYQILTAMVRGK